MNLRLHIRAAAATAAGALFVLPNPMSGATTNITYGDYFFHPATVTINIGDTVNWTPAGTDTHTLLGTGADPMCGGGLLPCSHTFKTAGSFAYECTIPGHAKLGMVGTIIVLPPPVPPVIAVQPQSQIALTNSTVTLFVTSTNALTYQWQSNLVNLTGATNSSLVLSNVTFADSATYRVILGDTAGTVPSSNAVLQVVPTLAPIIETEPKSQTALTNSTVSFLVQATNPDAYQWQSNSADIPGATNSSLTLSNVVIGDSADYRVVLTNTTGATTGSVAVLIVGFPIEISAAPGNLDVTAGTLVTFQISAAGAPPPQYQWYFDGASLPGQTNSALALGGVAANLAGTYAVTVSNAFGAPPASNAVLTVEPLTSIVRQKLVLTASPAGAGTMVPNLNNRPLVVARAYTVQAVPGRGEAFESWTGFVQSADPALTFVMPSLSNATLTANFIPTPFTNNVAGNYTGLFWDPNSFSNATAGYFSASVAGNGVAGGIVKLAGETIPWSCVLRADGGATQTLNRRHGDSLLLTLQADLGGAQTITGTVSDVNHTFNASLVARRAGFNAGNPAAGSEGYYTWVAPGPGGNGPAGYSYGTASVGAGGALRTALFLSDGAATVATGAVATNGQAPLYISLYGGKGSFLSWLTFSNATTAIITNTAFWLRDPSASGLYASGFNLTNLPLWLAPYKPDANGGNALVGAGISVNLTDGDLRNPMAGTVLLNPNGLGGNYGSIVITAAAGSGLFTGLFPDPVARQTIRFNGVVLRPAATGYGFFLGSRNLSGSVVLKPQ